MISSSCLDDYSTRWNEHVTCPNGPSQASRHAIKKNVQDPIVFLKSFGTVRVKTEGQLAERRHFALSCFTYFACEIAFINSPIRGTEVYFFFSEWKYRRYREGHESQRHPAGH